MDALHIITLHSGDATPTNIILWPLPAKPLPSQVTCYLHPISTVAKAPLRITYLYPIPGLAVAPLRNITLYPSDVNPKNIILRAIPVSPVTSPNTIILRPASVSSAPAGLIVTLWPFTPPSNPTPPVIVENIFAMEFPLTWYQGTSPGELRSRVTGATITRVANTFPLELIKTGKAASLQSKWS